MLHIRQAREADKPAIEAMYGRRVRYNDAHGIHQWNPDEVSWEAFSKLYSIADYYVGKSVWTPRTAETAMRMP